MTIFYPRIIQKEIEKEISTPEIIVLTGARQGGKTTLLKQIYEKIPSKNKVFLDFENLLHQKVFKEENYDNVWHNLAEFGVRKEEKAYIFIDEVQLYPSAVKVIKYIFDHYKTKFFLTGSSSFYLKGLFPESLAGRKLVFELFPLSFREFLVFKGVRKDFEDNFSLKAKRKSRISYELYKKFYLEYLTYGGFPKVVLEENYERKKRLLEEIFSSYFEKDVKTLADFRDIGKLKDLIFLLFPRVGGRVNIDTLASNLEVSRQTVYSYLQFLEQTYLIKLLPKYSKDKGKKVIGQKKLYFSDTGLVSQLFRASLGQLFENSVFQNLRVFYKDIFYFRAKSGREIDFILPEGIGLEAKINVEKRDLTTLKNLAKKLSLKEFYIVSLEASEFDRIIPAVEV